MLLEIWGFVLVVFFFFHLVFGIWVYLFVCLFWGVVWGGYF